MKKHIQNIFLIILLNAVWQSAFSQEYILNFRTYSTEDGLASNLIHQILEDKKGFVWFATKEGISRFDGKTFKNFLTADPDLPSNYCLQLKTDINGFIWTAFYKKRSTVREENIAYHYLIDTNFQVRPIGEVYEKEIPFAPDDIFSARNFNTDTLYITLRSGKIFKFDGVFTEIPSHPKCAKKRILQIESNGNIHLINKQSFVTINNLGALVKEDSIPFGGVNPLKENGQHWFTTKFKAQLLDRLHISPKTPDYDSLLFSYHTFPEDIPLKKLQILRFYFENQEYYIGRGRSLLKLYDENFNQIYDFSEDLHKQYENMLVGSSILLRENQIWFSNNQGFCIVDYKPNPFRKYLKDPASNSVRGIYQNQNDHLFVNTAQGFKEINLKTGEVNANFSNSLYLNWGMVETSDDFLFGSYGSSFLGYNKVSKQSRHIIWRSNHHPKNSVAISQPFKDKFGNIYLGTSSGLAIYNEALDSLESYDKYNTFESLKSEKVNHFQEKGREIWLATTNGLYVMDYEKGITAYHEPLPDLSIMNFYKDGDIFWLATYGKGLIKWDKATGITVHYGKKNGFLSENLTALFPDSWGNLWIATEMGLVRFHIKTEDLHIFLESDGITNNEFNRGSDFQNEEGTIYFGGLNGVTAFHPKDFIKTEKSVYPLQILDYYELNHKTGVFEEKTNQLLGSNKIQLTPNIKSFRIHFSLLNYIHSNKTQYAYKIEGYDQNWNHQNENFIRINELPYGDYTLKIKAQSYEGHWMPDIMSIPITVEIPFYEKTGWQIFGFLIFGFLVFLRYKWGLYKFHQREMRLEKVVLERTKIINDQKQELESLNTTKDRLFSIIGHDLRDPVIAFKNLSEKIAFLVRKNDMERVIDLSIYIEKEAQYLHDLLDNLLNWALTQRNELRVIKTSVSVYQIIEKIKKDNEHLAALSKVELKNEMPKVLNVMSDRPILETVFRNLISNAFKHTKKGNSILIWGEIQDKTVDIFVEDDGLGMNHQQLENLFEIKKEALNGRNVSFGLHLCRELINLLDGKSLSSAKKEKALLLRLPYPKEFNISWNRTNTF